MIPQALDDHRSRPRPRVLIVGGCDVQLRIDLMKALSDDFAVAAVGSNIELATAFADARLPFYYCPLERGSSPVSDLLSVAHLRRLFRLLRPDIVHAFATKPCVWGRLAARSVGVPVVIGTIPGLGALYALSDLRTRALRKVYERLQRTACRVSDLTIFQNERDAREFLEAGIAPPESTAIVRGSGVRTDLLDPASVPGAMIERIRAEARAMPGDVVVTMITRLIRSKGVLLFAEVAERLRTRHPEARFVLVGPADHESLDRLTESELERIKRSVIWLGERSDVGTILASSDIFVLPTYYREGIPRVLLEAAAMGRPLVTTRTPGCEDVVTDGINGLLVPPHDVDALARAISRLVEDPEARRRFGIASRQLAIEKFDLRIIARKTAGLYRNLLERKLGDARTVPVEMRPGTPSTGKRWKRRHLPVPHGSAD